MHARQFSASCQASWQPQQQQWFLQAHQQLSQQQQQLQQTKHQQWILQLQPHPLSQQEQLLLILQQMRTPHLR
jgi:hypothetical protein